MKGRDPMKGRHAVGGRTANPGKMRGGGSEPSGNRPITGVSPSSPSRSMQPKAGVLANQAKTSADLQARLQGKAPQPFTNTGGAATTSTSPSPRGAKPGLEPKGIYAGLQHSNPGVKTNPSGAATGYSKLPSQSGQIGGRMGFPPPKRKAGDNGSGYPSKRNASFYGE